MCCSGRESLDEIRAAVRDAVHCHFEDEELPRVIRLHIVKDEQPPTGPSSSTYERPGRFLTSGGQPHSGRLGY